MQKICKFRVFIAVNLELLDYYIGDFEKLGVYWIIWTREQRQVNRRDNLSTLGLYTYLTLLCSERQFECFPAGHGASSWTASHPTLKRWLSLYSYAQKIPLWSRFILTAYCDTPFSLLSLLQKLCALKSRLHYWALVSCQQFVRTFEF